METTSLTQMIRRYLETLEANGVNRLPDFRDNEVYEVIATVPWVRESLAEFSPGLDTEGQREVMQGLKTLAA